MDRKKPAHKKRTIALAALLAVVCIGGAELLACRYFAPELYQQITAPARRGWEAAVSLSRDISRQAAELDREFSLRSAELRQGLSLRASALWAELTAPEASEELSSPPEEGQVAGRPVLVDSAPVTDPLATELKQVDGQEVLTGGLVEMIYYNQADAAWADQPYGSDHIGGYGCGPVAMAMAVSSLTDQVIDPAAMAQFAAEQGHWARKSGSYLSIVEGIAQAYGLSCQPLAGRTPEDLRDALLSGQVLVALMGPGHFTQGGHFILLRGVTLNGMILVADPNSRERSLTLWDPQLILDELSASTARGAPLWGLTPPDAATRFAY